MSRVGTPSHASGDTPNHPGGVRCSEDCPVARVRRAYARLGSEGMEDDLEQVTVRLIDGTTETWDGAEVLANGVLKVSEAATPASDGQPDSAISGVEVTYYGPHAWISVTPSTRHSQEPIKRGLYI